MAGFLKPDAGTGVKLILELHVLFNAVCYMMHIVAFTFGPLSLMLIVGLDSTLLSAVMHEISTYWCSSHYLWQQVVKHGYCGVLRSQYCVVSSGNGAGVDLV